MIGRVFQDPMAGTAPHMTIEENMAIAYGRTNRRGLRFGVTHKRKEFFKESLSSLGFRFRKSNDSQGWFIIWWRTSSAIAVNGYLH